LLTDRYLNGIPDDSRMARDASLKKSALTPELLKKLRELNVQAAEQEKTLAEFALRYVLDQPGVTSVIVGASSVEQLAADLKAIQPEPQD
jgi:L-glyceraldehyde 3-phosphate reductase